MGRARFAALRHKLIQHQPRRAEGRETRGTSAAEHHGIWHSCILMLNVLPTSRRVMPIVGIRCLRQPDKSDFAMQRSLAASSIECARSFDRLAELLNDPDCQVRSALRQFDVEDQSVRFRVWAGNLGAFQRLSATASLDHRLQESPKIAAQIQELLNDISDTVETSKHLLQSSQNWHFQT
jgi:hypothetical protein